MFFSAFFKRLYRKRLIRSLKNGSLIGSCECGGRRVHIYLLDTQFVQVMYKDDNSSQEVEHIEKFSDLEKLNSYLEKEFRAVY